MPPKQFRLKTVFLQMNFYFYRRFEREFLKKVRMELLQIDKMLEEKGYIDEPVDPRLKLVEEINRLKKEKNAIILSHFYVEGDLQDIADYVGDSLGLSIQAAQTQADVIVFCGVLFMAETAGKRKISLAGVL